MKKTISLPPKVKRGDKPWTIDVPEWAQSMANEEARWPVNKSFKSKPGSSTDMLLVEGPQFSRSLTFSIEVPKDFRVTGEVEAGTSCMSVHIKLAPTIYEEIISICSEPAKPKNASLENLVAKEWKLKSLPTLEHIQPFQCAEITGSVQSAEPQVTKVLVDEIVFYQRFYKSKRDLALHCELLGLDSGRLITIRSSCCHDGRTLERFDHAEDIIKSIRKIN